MVTDDADAGGVVLTLSVGPSGHLDADALRAWYGRCGFVANGGQMRRAPQASRHVAPSTGEWHVVCRFAPGAVEWPDRTPIGGKAEGLARLSAAGLPVPPGFVVMPGAGREGIAEGLARLRDTLGVQPLVSVRSSPTVSMPGMMDTVLNVGLSRENADEWVPRIGARAVLDAWSGAPESTSPARAVEAAAAKVASSWSTDRAAMWRTIQAVGDGGSFAVIVQAMVFGNAGPDSGAGVLFSRCPLTGQGRIVGEFVAGRQGASLVGGVATPEPIDGYLSTKWGRSIPDLLARVEALFDGAVVEVEFTVDRGVLYFLQARPAVLAPAAAVRIFAEGGKPCLPPGALRFGTAVDPQFRGAARHRGLPACTGVASGRPVATAAEAIAAKEPVILVTEATLPDDVAGMRASAGVLTRTGGITCHAAVVARALNLPLVVGCGDLDLAAVLREPVVSICGATGRVWFEAVPKLAGTLPAELRSALLKHWAGPLAVGVPDPTLSAHRQVVHAADWWGLPDQMEIALSAMAEHSDLDLALDCRHPREFAPPEDAIIFDLAPDDFGEVLAAALADRGLTFGPVAGAVPVEAAILSGLAS